MFREAATLNELTYLQEYTDSVMDYIKKCTDDVTTMKIITVHSNQKPWMTGEVCSLLKTRDKAFRKGDPAVLKTARNYLALAKNYTEQG